ncbi:hypothetical protein LMG31841_00548 [Paraburkholderia saeva]|uniref:Uncharacterized protein n=2 Tax=Paraburkholderia saeva TaxID=2777537 RepID=A0A9N8WZQ2_9BURK|nr:hypothetical protein LMG31841_00548 [Paraburkholderia saeva]CAG4901637.1 hypothetical protein R70241_02886 [Paraburkholderia saeva]
MQAMRDNYCADEAGRAAGKIMKADVIETGVERDLHALCLYLFDVWCERRNVIPLAYLMHNWPMVSATAETRTRLVKAFRDLQKWHADALFPAEHQMISRVLAQST